MTSTASKEVQFDTAHRVPHHASKCRNLHGHRYRVRVTVEGDLVTTTGVTDQGMVIDFAAIKATLTTRVHDVLDHALVLADWDPLVTALRGQDLAIVTVPFVPTAEELARWVWHQVHDPIGQALHCRGAVSLVELWETPTSLATYRGQP